MKQCDSRLSNGSVQSANKHSNVTKQNVIGTVAKAKVYCISNVGTGESVNWRADWYKYQTLSYADELYMMRQSIDICNKN